MILTFVKPFLFDGNKETCWKSDQGTLQFVILTFVKPFLFDGNEETCWNSDQGAPQFVILTFVKPVIIHKLVTLSA